MTERQPVDRSALRRWAIYVMQWRTGLVLIFAERAAQVGDRNSERRYAVQARKMARIAIRWRNIEAVRDAAQGDA